MYAYHCICLCVIVCVHVCVCVCVSAWTCRLYGRALSNAVVRCIYVYMYVCVSMYMFVCVCACLCVCVCVCVRGHADFVEGFHQMLSSGVYLYIFV